MAAGRRLLLPSSVAVLFYANLLSAFLGERSVGYTASEGQKNGLRLVVPFLKSLCDYSLCSLVA